MKILISGATGFIGGHVLQYLTDLGYECDTISSQEMNNESMERLYDFQLTGCCGRPDVFVHCGWIREQDLQSMKHFEMAELSCHYINECKKLGIRFINIGSSSEYGVKDLPMQEDMLCKPINTYGIAKLMVTLFAQKLGFNTLRVFTVTGKGGHSFKDNYVGYKKWGNPRAVRDYVTVLTVCRAIESLVVGENIVGEIINVCSGKQYSNTDIVYHVDEFESHSQPIQFDDNKWCKSATRQYEPSHWVGCPDKAINLLNIKDVRI